jgi:hypothetical protein
MSNLIAQRTIKVMYQSGGGLKTLQSAASTWGQLKDSLSNLYPSANFNKLKAVDRATKVSYEVDDAVLPQNDLVLFIFPKEIKSGASIQSSDVKELSEMSYNYLRSYGSKCGIDVSGKKADIVKRIAEYNKANTVSKSKVYESKPSKTKTLETKKETTKEVVF